MEKSDGSPFGERKMENPRRIFVQVPSYRDKQLIPTLLDMIENAEVPAELRIVVCWQHDSDESLNEFIGAGFTRLKGAERNGQIVHYLARSDALVEVIDVHFLRTKGCGWARSTAQRHYEGEKYSLQMDAHHRFIKGWDSVLIDMVESLRDRYRKPLMTGYPPAFHPETYPEKKQNFACQMLAKSFSEYGIVKFRPVAMVDAHLRTEPMRARFISGGFIFADGSIVEEVMNDEEHFFSTEEIAMAIRAYTHGYSFFHPHRVVLWHQYRSAARKVWEDHTPERKAIGEIEATALDRSGNGRDRFMKLLCSASQIDMEDMGQFGLGKERTISQYERFAGLSFKHRGLRKEAMTATEPGEFDVDIQDSGWEEDLICTRLIRIRIGLHGQDLSDVKNAAVVLTAFDLQGVEIAQQRLQLSEFKESVDGENLDYFFAIEASPSKVPSRYELVPGQGLLATHGGPFAQVEEVTV